MTVGRPVAIFEHDFDTELPSIEEVIFLNQRHWISAKYLV